MAVGYDAADQLTAAVHQTTDPTPSLLARYAYAYDPAGNRTVEQIDDAVTVTTHDRLNRLVTQAPGGVLRFAGTVNEPATVQGQPATVTAGGQFAAGVPVTGGTNTVPITACNMACAPYASREITGAPDPASLARGLTAAGSRGAADDPEPRRRLTGRGTQECG